jgi:hypothetical protein
MDDVSPAASRAVYKSMIRKSGSRFSEKIMLKQSDLVNESGLRS